MEAKDANTDVIIIGAGPAGATAAALLCRQGYRVVVVERAMFPRFVIGESLLPQCMDVFADAGLLDAVQAQGYQRKNGAAFLRGTGYEVFDFGKQYTAGWSHTYQVPRADFDLLLARGAVDAGADIRYGHAVADADFTVGQPRLTVESATGARESLSARFVLDASGFGLVLPRLLGLATPSAFPRRTAVFSHVGADRRDDKVDVEKIWICTHPVHSNVWYWVIPFADGTASVGVVAPSAYIDTFPEAADERLAALIDEEPNVRRRLGGLPFVFTPKAVSAYASGVTQTWGDGYALLGNAAGFLDPIFSSGVTIAVKSASRAVELLVKQLEGDSVDWQRDFADYIGDGVAVFETFVKAWYDGSLQNIIFHHDKPDDITRKVCSILAGYVWDKSNPYVQQHRRRIKVLAKVCEPVQS